MLRGNKTNEELRFELLALGIILLSAAVCWVIFRHILPSMTLFIPGLIMLGSAIFQDLQTDWHAGWHTYALAVVMVSTGLAGVVNTFLGDAVKLNWVVITIVELGAILIAKALYDPSLGPQE